MISDEDINKINNNVYGNIINKSKKSKPIAQIDGMSDVYEFKIKLLSNTLNNFDFLKLYHRNYKCNVLAQITNIKRDLNNSMVGICKVIGYRENGRLVPIRQPFDKYTNIEIADSDFIEQTIGLNRVDGAFLGTLEYHDDLKISMEYKELLTKHISILAKSGVGKSYTLSVLLEEVMSMDIPVIVIDPHDEYKTFLEENDDIIQLDKLKKLKLKPKHFKDKVKLYSPQKVDGYERLSLPLENLRVEDLINSMPQKLSPSQQGLIYNILNNSMSMNLDELIFNLSNEESTSKYSLITLIEQLKKSGIFSHSGTPLNELVCHKRLSIINLKGMNDNMSDIVVSNLLKQLFHARKSELIPPFLLVLEESHNFCPEKSLGKKRSNEIVGTIAGEGRKFGCGLCLVSQRPAKVDKNVLSQCQTQIIMKLTNANDLKAVINSSEGLDNDNGKEIERLSIGTCILTGIIDTPLKINVRPRMSKHGGNATNIM